MPLCKNDPKRKYKGDEPSPKGLGWCAHGEKEGKVRKGLDGNKWVVKKVSSDSLRWVKQSNDKSTTIKVNKSVNKIDCSKFVIYRKKTKSKFGFIRIESLMGLSATKNSLYKYKSYNDFQKKPTIIPDGFKKNKISKSIIENYCGDKQFLMKQTAPKINHLGCKKYFIHDNGGRPFLAYVGKTDVYIYKINEKYEIKNENYNRKNKNNSWMYTQLVKEYKNVVKIYIGKSPLNPSTKFSGGHGKSFDGNSILLQLTNNKCISIGWNIYEFTLLDNIENYYSPVGNSDVPYPFIIGDKYIYFMLDKTYIDRKYLPTNLTKTEMTDLYSFYYGHSGNEELSKYKKKMKNVKIIQDRL